MRQRSIIAGLFVLAAWHSVAAQGIDPRARRVDSLLGEWNRPGSPGVAVAVVRDGKVLFENGYGLASLEHNVRITPSTVFDVASVSKQFAGLAIAMLVDQGRIKLTDDVRTYIPELNIPGHTITIDHLLHHTSGLRDWPGGLALAGWRMDDVISFDQILRFAYAQRSLNFIPGAEYTYSNTGYNLLAEVVARVTGKSFRQWTDEHLFQPLGMRNSRFVDDHTRIVANRAYGYARADSGWRAVNNQLMALGSSSLFSTASDMAKWLANFDDARVGGRRAIELMRTRGTLNNGSTIPYAFGISHDTYRGAAGIAHSGSWAGFVSYLMYFPEKRFGVVVLANTGVVPVQQTAFRLTDAFLGDELAPLPTPSVSLAAQPEVTLPHATLDRYTGTYRLGPGWYVRIRRDGNALRTQATREGEFPLSPRSDSSFWVPAYNGAMTFTRDSTGAVVLLYRNLRVPRIGAPVAARTGTLSELAGDYVSEELQTTYTVSVQDTTVKILHRRHGSGDMTRAFGDDWAAAPWFLQSVEFQRDVAGRVTGFVVNAGPRVRNVRFVKR